MVLNISVATIHCLAFFISSCAAWLQRHRDSVAVKIFYGSTVLATGLNAALYVYRGYQGIAGMRICLLLLNLFQFPHAKSGFFVVGLSTVAWCNWIVDGKSFAT